MNFGKPVKSQCNFLKYHEYDHSPKDYGLGMLCSFTCNAHQNFNITNREFAAILNIIYLCPSKFIWKIVIHCTT